MTVDRIEDYWSKTLQADVEIRPVEEEFKVYIDGVHSYTAWDLRDAEDFLNTISEVDKGVNG
jgi:hypothetical protein